MLSLSMRDKLPSLKTNITPNDSVLLTIIVREVNKKLYNKSLCVKNALTTIKTCIKGNFE